MENTQNPALPETKSNPSTTTDKPKLQPKKKTKPEQWAEWLFKTCGSWRNILAFGLVVALTYISIRFNYELGKLNAVDETSKSLLPVGYALLDLSALFLSGYVGLKTKSPVRKLIAWVWFAFLLCLSLWAAAAFTMSVDYRQSLAPLESQIEQKQRELDTQRASVETWQNNVESAVIYKTKHQSTLSREQIKETMLARELAHLESQRVPPAQIIYERAAPYVGIDPQALQLTIRLLWAAALTLSPIILVLLVAVEFGLVRVDDDENKPTLAPKTKPTGSDGPGKSGKAKAPHKPSNITPQKPHNLTDLGNPPLTQMSKKGKEEINAETGVPASRTKERAADSADTGTDSGKATRYTEVKEQVRAGKVRPSKPAIKKAAQCGQATAEKYLAAMVEEGIIIRLDNGQHKLAQDNIVNFAKAVEGGRA
jgi:hypothetical protein